MSAVDIAIPRVAASEAFRDQVYDDATGNPIQCAGQPTVGYGCRCRQWSVGLAATVLRYQLEELDVQLSQHPWYVNADDTRKSVFVEIGFNQGYAGLMRYPQMLAAATAGNWSRAAEECTVADTRLKARYAHLADLLEAGE